MKNIKRLIAAILTVFMLCSSFGVYALEGESYTSGEQKLLLSVQEAIQQGAAYMLNPVGSYYPEKGLSFGTLQGDWAAFALGRSGLAIPYDVWETYAENSRDDIVAAINKVYSEHSDITSLPLLHYRKRTENMRAIIGYTSVGFDPTNVSGYDITRALGNYTDIIWQGINATIFTLISLDTLNYEMPELTAEELSQGVHGTAVQATREMLVTRIMAQELPSGGWVLDTGFEVEDDPTSGDITLSTDKADPDITAMAIQALARYSEDTVYVNGTEKKVGDAIERALNALSSMQKSAGDFESWGTTNVESTAQVLMALIAMGIDPLEDERFITSSGNTILNGILKYHVSGSGFKHVADGSVNAMATDQAMYALVAYDRYLKGQNYIYNMSDNKTAHTVSLKENEYGTLSASVSNASQGEKVTVYASSTAGYALSEVKVYLYQSEISFVNNKMVVSWELTPTYQQADINADGQSATFTMPNVPVIVIAEFSENGQSAEKYEFIQTSVNGTVRVSKESASAGETVLVNPKPLSGYEYVEGSICVTDSNGDAIALTKNASGGYEFIMPAGNVTLYAEFEAVKLIGSVTISVEKFTIGQGYAIEPMQVELYQNDSVASIVTRLLDEHDMAYTLGPGASVESGFYLASITDGSDPNEPITPFDYIVEAINAEYGELSYTRDGESLGEFDYTQQAGWMYSVNGAFPNYGASDYKTTSKVNPLKDGDVIRWQFTLWGLGTDIGGGFDGDDAAGTFEGAYITIAERTAATSTVSDVNSNYSSWVGANRAAYDAAINAMTDLTLSEAELNAAIKPLRTMLAANKDEFNIILPYSAAANGHTIAAPATAKAGDDVTVTVTPNEGYELYLGSLKANGVKLTKRGTSYTFVMPSEDVAITAIFCEEGTGPKLVLGDVSGDGVLNTIDVALLCRHLMGQAELSSDAVALADMNEDGKVTIADAILLCKRIAAN